MPDTGLRELKKKFHERNYKFTLPRQKHVNLFIDNPGNHLSAEDVHSLVKQQSSDIGIATVYRTIELLNEMDILHKIQFGDGCSRYEYNDSSAHHHHHLICLACGKVKEFDDDLLETLEELISQKSNFQIIDHQVKFYGYCKECQSKQNN